MSETLMVNPKTQRRSDAKLIRDAMPEDIRIESSKEICKKIKY